MIELGSIAAAAVCAVPGVMAAYAGYFSWRGKRRNADGVCAHCGGPQYAAPGYEAPALVQGRLACAKCAARSRTRVRTALVAAGSLSAAAVIVAGTAAVTGASGIAFPLIVVGQYAGVFGGAVAWMKRRNRLALAESPALAPVDAHPRLAPP